MTLGQETRCPYIFYQSWAPHEADKQRQPLKMIISENKVEIVKSVNMINSGIGQSQVIRTRCERHYTWTNSNTGHNYLANKSRYVHRVCSKPHSEHNSRLNTNKLCHKGLQIGMNYKITCSWYRQFQIKQDYTNTLKCASFFHSFINFFIICQNAITFFVENSSTWTRNVCRWSKLPTFDQYLISYFIQHKNTANAEKMWDTSMFTSD